MSGKCRDARSLTRMVVFPINPSPELTGDDFVSAWEAIERKQREPADDWWLVAQPDHANIAGTIARNIASRLFPVLDEDPVQAIAQHDDGWASFDGAPQSSNGRPLSFLDAPVAEFLEAWRGSITRAEQHSALGGILVSQHFCRIAQVRPSSAPAAGDQLLKQFLSEENARQARLMQQQDRPEQEIHALVDVLQFCDLLSLYVCCGSRENIEFPQRFHGTQVRLQRDGELCRLEPSIFGGGMSLAVPARKFSDFGQSRSLPILFS